MTLKSNVLNTSAWLFLLSSVVTSLCFADILFIGDSHVQGTFGRTLDQSLRDSPRFQQHRIMTIGVGGAVPLWYLEGTQSPWGFFSRDFDGTVNEYEHPSTPLIDNLLTELRPHSTVIIELGTNFLWHENQAELEPTTKELIAVIENAGASCIWVGPPPLGIQYENEIKSIDRQLKEIISSTHCQWISSQALTSYPDSPDADHIHYDRAGPAGVENAKLWARHVLTALIPSMRQKR